MPFSANDAVMATLGSALDAVSLRQRVTADNIANIDTPGFRAVSIEFESSLRSALTDGDPRNDTVTASTRLTETPVDGTGNSVDLRKETLTAMQSQYQYAMLTRAVTNRFELLKTVAG